MGIYIYTCIQLLIPFGDHPLELGMMQRRFAWPLCKDETRKSRSVNNVIVIISISINIIIIINSMFIIVIIMISSSSSSSSMRAGKRVPQAVVALPPVRQEGEV